MPGWGFCFHSRRVPNTGQNRTEQLNQVIASDRNVLIRNNRNMFYVSLSYNINWGRSIFQSNKRLQNADRMNSILKVNDN